MGGNEGTYITLSMPVCPTSQHTHTRTLADTRFKPHKPGHAHRFDFASTDVSASADGADANACLDASLPAGCSSWRPASAGGRHARPYLLLARRLAVGVHVSSMLYCTRRHCAFVASGGRYNFHAFLSGETCVVCAQTSIRYGRRFLRQGNELAILCVRYCSRGRVQSASNGCQYRLCMHNVLPRALPRNIALLGLIHRFRSFVSRHS